jgi:hypothetical protein
MTKTYTIHARCVRSFTSWIDIEADTPEEALAQARLQDSDLIAAVKDEESWPWDEFTVYDPSGKQLLHALDDASQRKAVPELLEALIDLLGDRPSVQGGICQHCGRDYIGDMIEGDCPSDDCPSFKARAAIAKATGRPA